MSNLKCSSYVTAILRAFGSHFGPIFEPSLYSFLALKFILQNVIPQTFKSALSAVLNHLLNKYC